MSKQTKLDFYNSTLQRCTESLDYIMRLKKGHIYVGKRNFFVRMSLLSLEFHSKRSRRNFFRKFRFCLSFLALTLITTMTEKKFGIVYFQLFNGCWLAEIVSKSRKKLQQQDIFPPFFIWRPKTHKKPVMSVWELRAPMTV